MSSWNTFEERFPVMAPALKKARANGRLAHAYLLNADDPQTRLWAPKALAQLRCCLTPGADMTPCGICRHCRGIENGSYPELFTLSPISKSRQIRIGEDQDEPDSMRWFESQFYYAASSDEAVKIGVIQDAECLNEQAQNAFLKTLEEPPRQTLFMLVTATPSKLLPTIISRCQTLLLLSNRCRYPETLQERVLPLFKRLQGISGNLSEAEGVAGELIGVSGALKTEAESQVSPQWEARFGEANRNEWSSADKKFLEARFAGAVQAEYLNMRHSFCALIYDFFALSWQCSSGIAAGNTLFGNLAPIDEKRAAAQLKAAETLLDNLRFNVNEELALRSFVLDAAFA